jgi:hypothetical protein
VACPQTASPGRLAVICLVPDPGHLIPLLKLAGQARPACEVLVLAPDELIGLATSYGFSVAGLGPVRPAGGLSDLHRYINASERVRIASALSACQKSYFRPLAEGLRRSLHPLRVCLSEYRPSHILADDHMVPPGFNGFLREFKCRVYFHCTAPNYRRHNTWSLKSCFWFDFRGAANDVVSKTRNELRLWSKPWLPKQRSGSAAAPGPIHVGSTPINHLSTGTSYLEKALLSDHLLYAGEDRTILPAIPPLQAALPSDLRDWLDESGSADVVYISFGSMIQLDQQMIMNMVSAILDQDKRILLQYTGAFPATPGVRVEHWVAQSAVLSHPAVSLFVTHGGAASVEEGLWSGKPMLCIPGVWDHYYNSRIVCLLGAGVSIPRRRFGLTRRVATGVRTAMRREYADTARTLAALMREHWSAHRVEVMDLFQSPESERKVAAGNCLATGRPRTGDEKPEGCDLWK